MQHCEKVRAKQCDRDRSTRGMVEGELSFSVGRCVGGFEGWPGLCKNLSRSPTLSLASPLLSRLSRKKTLKRIILFSLVESWRSRYCVVFRFYKNDAASSVTRFVVESTDEKAKKGRI